MVGVLVVGGAVGVIYGVNVAATTAAADAVFADALEECGVPNNADAEVSDGGRTLTINVRGEEDFSGISYAEMECIERALNTPQSVISHIGQTTSMDGRQSESWDGITMSWSYHPDRGLDSVYTFDASKK